MTGEKKILLVGEAPGRSCGEDQVLEGPSGRRLSRLFGTEWRDVADGINLLDWRQASDANGEAKFPSREARAAARMLVRVHPRMNGASRPYDATVLLGRRVSAAFGISGVEYFQVLELEKFETKMTVAVVPHPSGRSRWWNSKTNVDEAVEWFRSMRSRS